MRSLVFVRNLFEGTQELLPFLSCIFGLHDESEAVEFVLIPGRFAFRDHLAQSCEQIRHRFRGDQDEQSATDAQFTIGRAGFDGGTAALNFNVPEDLIGTVAPNDLANEPGHHRDIWDYHRSRSSHLFYSKRRPSFTWFRQQLAEQYEDVDAERHLIPETCSS